MRTFWPLLWQNKVGLIGFIGLVFYLLLITVFQWMVGFDNEVKLDQINSPPGSRLVLLTRPEDKDSYTKLQDLVGHKVGILEKSGAPTFLEKSNVEGLEVETYRWRSGRGVPESLEALAAGEVDALIIFSKLVRRYVLDPSSRDYKVSLSHLTVSNPKLGPALLLGADTQGRDMFTHVINGGRILIITAIMAGLISTAIAFILGTVAALAGGIVDRILVAIANFIIVIPRFPLLIVLAAMITLNNWLLLATLIGLLAWPALMRAIRAQVLSLRERDYVEAAMALDLSRMHIIFREILPNMMGFVVINFVVAITTAMYDQIGLIFLGMAPINDYTWGVMLYFGRSRGTLFNIDSAAMLLAPVLAIAFFQVCLVLFSRALEEAFDPRLRGAA
ncbi:MAG: ABC transporter permease subunit [Trueperaceae bacterium]|nr:ABC transporter permease subunit [Trueperaceae bacterium]